MKEHHVRRHFDVLLRVGASRQYQFAEYEADLPLEDARFAGSVAQ
jgi:hypothetical protein